MIHYSSSSVASYIIYTVLYITLPIYIHYWQVTVWNIVFVVKFGTLLVSYYSLYELLGTLLSCMGKFKYLLVHCWYVVLHYVLFIVHYWPDILTITFVAITHALYIFFCTLSICYITDTYNLLLLNQEVLEEDEPSRLVWKCSCPWINRILCALQRQQRLCGGPGERGFCST